MSKDKLFVLLAYLTMFILGAILYCEWSDDYCMNHLEDTQKALFCEE